MKTRLIIVGSFLALLALAFFLMPASKIAPRQQRTLPDGSILILESVTYGRNHNFYFDGSWWARLRRSLPRPLRNIAPGPMNMTSTGTRRPNGIVLWISRYVPATRTYGNLGTTPFELQMMDGHGCSEQLNSYSSSGGPNGFLINGFALDVFPRRQASFKLVVRDRNAKDPRPTVAEFDVANPGPVSHALWKPEPLPISRTNGGLEFVLAAWGRGSSGGRNVFYPSFEVREGGALRTDWAASGSTFRDASGNTGWQSLCTNETAWLLETEFYRTAEARFETNEIWAVPDLPIPGTNEIITTNLTGEVLGVALKLMVIAGPGSYTFTNGVLASPGTVISASFSGTSSGSDGRNSWSRKTAGGYGSAPRVEQFDITQTQHFILVEEGTHDPGLRLLVRARDEMGREIIFSTKGSDNQRAIVTLQPKPGARRMNLEFIMNRGRQVEFLAAPPLAEEKKRR